MCIYLKIRPIIIAAKNRSPAWGSQTLALIIDHTVAPITYRKIKPPIGPTGNAVQIVPLETNPYSKAIDQPMVLLSYAVIIFVD